MLVQRHSWDSELAHQLWMSSLDRRYLNLCHSPDLFLANLSIGVTLATSNTRWPHQPLLLRCQGLPSLAVLADFAHCSTLPGKNRRFIAFSHNSWSKSCSNFFVEILFKILLSSPFLWRELFIYFIINFNILTTHPRHHTQILVILETSFPE